MDFNKIIKRRIKENFKNNVYKKQFGTEIQSLIAENIDSLVEMSLEDNEIVGMIDYAIEDSIRVMIINK